MNKLIPSILLLAFGLAGPQLAQAKVDEVKSSHKIDQIVLQHLKGKGLKPKGITSDEVFVRRAYLDLAGRIPSLKELNKFKKLKNPNKRRLLVNELVGSDAYVSHQYNYWADLLRARSAISGNNQSIESGFNYERWIKGAVRENKPYDEMVFELLTASGASWENPAVGYYLRDYGMPLDNLAMTTQVFLGTQVVCAQCHDHPFDEWTQMDYYHLSAFTYGMVTTNAHANQGEAMDLLRKRQGKISDEKNRDMRKAFSEILFPVRFNNVNVTNRALRLPHDYQYDDAKPRSVVKPATLMGNEAVLSQSTPPVEAFADWMVSSENPRFTKVIANRLWKEAMGIALIEPVDDLTEYSVASIPELMDYLEKLMVDLDYDLQAYQRIIFNTKAYQREAVLEQPVPGAKFDFAGPILRRMSAEQIWDSLVALTVDNPERLDERRELAKDEAIAKVKLVAEAIYDQSPAEFLRNAQEVSKVQAALSKEIDKALEKVEIAREQGDPELIREASREASQIRRKLALEVEEKVYREGLQEQIEAVLFKSKKNAKPIEVVSAATGDEDFLSDIATMLLDEGKSLEEGMAVITGDEPGIINQLVTAMYEERRQELRAKAKREEAREFAAWEVKGPKDREVYKSFQMHKNRMLRASELPSPAPPGHFLREFGQSDRELIENSSDGASVTQALTMLNGPVIGSVTNRYSVLGRAMRDKKFSDRLDTIYLSMLSRKPTTGERRIFQQAWEADPDSGTTTGIVWTLLNTRQFLFIQ
ncbi:MAG: DUF1549 domain-containing protein [Verrucomicrobiota bacterium]